MRRIDEKDLIEMAFEANQIQSDSSTVEGNNFKYYFKILHGGLSIVKKLESFFLNANSSAERNRKFKRDNCLSL